MQHLEAPSASSPLSISRPVRRTYGRPRPRDAASSPPPFSFASSSWLRSSSPQSISRLETPPPPSSPVRSAKRLKLDEGLQGCGSALPGDDDAPVAPPPSRQGTLRAFFAPLPTRREPLQPRHTVPVSTESRALEHQISLSKSSTGPSTGKCPDDPTRTTVKSQPLQQTHLTHLPLLHTCKVCCMTYVRGGSDEGVHAQHHGRVLRGIPWDGLGRGKARSGQDQTLGRVSREVPRGKRSQGGSGWREVESVRFGRKQECSGRIIVCEGSWGGSKLDEILQTVDLSLSSPPLPPAILEHCKIFLLLTSVAPPLRPGSKITPGMKLGEGKGKKSAAERVVSVVVAQGIKWAMAVLDGADAEEGRRVVDSGGGVVCDPTPLSTPLGIHRLYTIPSYRSLGLAQRLLTAACAHTVYGCTFDPRAGQVAFSQPTESGRAVMLRWGGGGKGAVRVFVDDESQI